MTVQVVDPFNVTQEPSISSLPLALDPVHVQPLLRTCLNELPGSRGSVHLKAIRVVRYKPGRRCLIEYDVEVTGLGKTSETITIIGKVRAKGISKTGYELVNTLWESGFSLNNPDKISVPEPIGVIPELNMWLQRKVPGRVAGDLLTSSDWKSIAKRIAETAYKLHMSGIPASRTHTMQAELSILHEHLPIVCKAKPQWSSRIKGILEASDRLGAATPKPVVVGIHRDFYFDQVIVDGPRLYLLDLDLYCMGDRGLDIGNFIAHITEYSLRNLGNAMALVDFEKEIEDQFIELSGKNVGPAVKVYSTLTLVRHIYISTLFPERSPFTEALLEICEERLNL